MILLRNVGLGLLLVGCLTAIYGIFSGADLVPILVLCALLFAFGGVLSVVGHRISSGFARDAAQVAELGTRGVRRRGIVRDALPLGSPHGGAAFLGHGAQMVLSVELEDGARVTCHVVEPSESARARIGSSIVVLEHPEARGLRTVEGFLPNGRRA